MAQWWALSELISTCSFVDITHFTCILILYGLSHKKSSGFISWKLVGLDLQTLWKSRGNIWGFCGAWAVAILVFSAVLVFVIFASISSFRPVWLCWEGLFYVLMLFCGILVILSPVVWKYSEWPVYIDWEVSCCSSAMQQSLTYTGEDIWSSVMVLMLITVM